MLFKGSEKTISRSIDSKNFVFATCADSTQKCDKSSDSQKAEIYALTQTLATRKLPK